MSLEEVRVFVQKHKHLPGIPSAGDVENYGFELGDMQAKLFQKIEEVYLHLFDLKAELERCKDHSETRK